MPSKEEIKSFMFQLDAGIMAGLGDNPRPIDEVLRIHLLTENLLDKIISKTLGSHAEAVLSSRLSYNQKLSIAGKLKFDDGTSILSSDAKGSLKKLNLLRNDVAHDLTHETNDEDVEALFVGTIGKNRSGPALTGSVWDKLSSYKASIFREMLDKDFSNKNT